MPVIILVILQTYEYCLKNEICVLLGHYAAYSGNSLATFPNALSVIEDGSDMLSRNFAKYLPLYAA